jgi:hypothetical protein
MLDSKAQQIQIPNTLFTAYYIIIFQEMHFSFK